MAEGSKHGPGLATGLTLNPISLFSSMPARYRIFILTLAFCLLALGASAALLGYNAQVFSNLALFFLNVVSIMLMAGLIYVLCFWTAMHPLKSTADYLQYVILAVLAYFGGAFLIGFFLYLSLTALAGQLTSSGLLIFVSLSMSVVLTFLARIFSAMEWKRAEDLVFSIAIYSVVVGTLFFDAQNQAGTILAQVGSVYSQAFGWAFIYVFIIAVLLELMLRNLYLRWHAQEQT